MQVSIEEVVSFLRNIERDNLRNTPSRIILKSAYSHKDTASRNHINGVKGEAQSVSLQRFIIRWSFNNILVRMHKFCNQHTEYEANLCYGP